MHFYADALQYKYNISLDTMSFFIHSSARVQNERTPLVLLSLVVRGMPHVLQWHLSLLLALMVASWEPPSIGAPCSTLGLPLPSSLLVWYSELGVCSIAISLLFIMVQTYEERWIPYPACGCVCLPLSACVRVWGRSTCSVVCVEERAELATLYVLAEVTAQAQWIPLRERMRGSPFWAPRNRCERGINFNQRYTHSVSTPTLGLDVRNGRFVQSPEVGLRSHCRAFPVPFIGCECASVRLVLFSWSRIPAVWQDCVMCVRAVRAAVIVLTGCVCVSVAGEKKTECR